MTVPDRNTKPDCDFSTKNISHFLPKTFRYSVFQKFHDLSNSGIKETMMVIRRRYVWSRMEQEIKNETYVVCRVKNSRLIDILLRL